MLLRASFGLAGIGALSLAPGGLVQPTVAQAQSVAGVDVEAVADAVASDGFYSDSDVNNALAESIRRANDNGIGFVSLNTSVASADAKGLSDSLLAAIEDRTSSYRTLVVLSQDGVTVGSNGGRGDEAADAAFEQFAAGATPAALDTVTDVITASAAGSDPDDDSGTSGLIWLSLLIFPVGGYFAFTYFRNKSRESEAVEQDIEADRAEIKEDLKVSADSVLRLGDEVIASGNDELAKLYEEASNTFQDVSMTVNDVRTAPEVSRLKHAIAEAAWQLDVVEARLAGRADPPRPA